MYEGIGYVQFRHPGSLVNARREYYGDRHMGKGMDPDTDLWTKSISFRVGECTKEFDIQTLERDWNDHFNYLSRSLAGTMSVVAPRVCTATDRDLRDRIMEHTEDSQWRLSPWEIEGRPDRRGDLETEDRTREFNRMHEERQRIMMEGI